MRKGAGISALSRHSTTNSSYAALSSSISSTQLSLLQSSLSQFQNALLQFTLNHKDDIKRDPAFRYQFQKMCAAIGVDPLAGSSSRKSKAGGGGVGGMWGEMIGLGEMVYEISVQVVDVCISSRGVNGGMIELQELTARINRMRGVGRKFNPPTTLSPASSMTTTLTPKEEKKKELEKEVGAITTDDVLRAIELLKPLYAGYTIVQIGHQTYVRSVPRELDTDQSTLLTLAASTGGRLQRNKVRRATGWTDVRITTVLDDCVMREGMGWVDDQAGTGEREVWLIAAVTFDET